MGHGPDEDAIGRATSDWMKARERLDKDPDADIDDLIGVTELQYPADANL